MEVERERQTKRGREREREQIIKFQFKNNTLFCTYIVLDEHLIYKPLKSG